MNKNKLADVTKNMKHSVQRHTPEILMGFGIAGMLTSTILAVKATPKAMKLIEDRKQETGKDELKAAEVFKTTWKCYIPSTTIAAASIGCLIGSSKVSIRRNAVLATAYKIAETAHKEYRDKVIETIGEKKEQLIKDKIAKDEIEKNPVSNREVIITDIGNTLCYDSFSGRYFKTDINELKKAENELNFRLLNENYVSLNDFYEQIGLERTSLGDDLGWNIDIGRRIEIEFSSQLNEKMQPCVVIRYNIAPKYEYWKMY